MNEKINRFAENKVEGQKKGNNQSYECFVRLRNSHESRFVVQELPISDRDKFRVHSFRRLKDNTIKSLHLKKLNRLKSFSQYIKKSLLKSNFSTEIVSIPKIIHHNDFKDRQQKYGSQITSLQLNKLKYIMNKYDKRYKCKTDMEKKTIITKCFQQSTKRSVKIYQEDLKVSTLSLSKQKIRFTKRQNRLSLMHQIQRSTPKTKNLKTLNNISIQPFKFTITGWHNPN